MAKRLEIEGAVLISPTLAVVGTADTCMLIDLDREAVTHRCKVEGHLRSAVLSPNGSQIALGLNGGYPAVWTLKSKKLFSIDTSVEIDGEMQSLGGWTICARPLAWLDASTIVMSGVWGGVIVANTTDGESEGAIFSEDELWFDDQMTEHKMHDAFSSAYDDGKLYEIIDDDSFHLYSVKKGKIAILEHSTPPGTLVRYSGLFLCGDYLVQMGETMAKVMRKSDRKLVAEHKRKRGKFRFSDLEQTRLFAYDGEAIRVLDDPVKGSWTICAKAKSALDGSATGARLLLQHKHTISIVDLATGKATKLDPAKL